ncbi:Hypothetical protein POVN_LOCUS484 [uncultured virus]|nr:Hypothetical protein POVN_LOCUS484 [uncultured virus]
MICLFMHHLFLIPLLLLFYALNNGTKQKVFLVDGAVSTVLGTICFLLSAMSGTTLFCFTHSIYCFLMDLVRMKVSSKVVRYLHIPHLVACDEVEDPEEQTLHQV